MLTPTNSFLLFGVLRLCQFWWRSIKTCDRESAHRWNDKDTNWFYNLSHATCYSYEQINIIITIIITIIINIIITIILFQCISGHRLLTDLFTVHKEHTWLSISSDKSLIWANSAWLLPLSTVYKSPVVSERDWLTVLHATYKLTPQISDDDDGQWCNVHLKAARDQLSLAYSAKVKTNVPEKTKRSSWICEVSVAGER